MKETKLERLILCLLWVVCSILAAAAGYLTVLFIQHNHYVLGGAAGFAALYFITSSLQTIVDFIDGAFSLLDKE